MSRAIREARGGASGAVLPVVLVVTLTPLAAPLLAPLYADGWATSVTSVKRGARVPRERRPASAVVEGAGEASTAGGARAARDGEGIAISRSTPSPKGVALLRPARPADP